MWPCYTRKTCKFTGCSFMGYSRTITNFLFDTHDNRCKPTLIPPDYLQRLLIVLHCKYSTTASSEIELQNSWIFAALYGYEKIVYVTENRHEWEYFYNLSRDFYYSLFFTIPGSSNIFRFWINIFQARMLPIKTKLNSNLNETL